MLKTLGYFSISTICLCIAAYDLRRGFVEDGKASVRRFHRRQNPITFWFQILVFVGIAVMCFLYGLDHFLKR